MKRVPLDHDDFEKWLAHNASSELILNRGNITKTKSTFTNYFQQGLKAGISLSRLMEMLPSIFSTVDYPPEEGRRVVGMLKQLTLKDFGASADENYN